MQARQIQIAIQKYLFWHHRYQKYIALGVTIYIVVLMAVFHVQIDPWT